MAGKKGATQVSNRENREKAKILFLLAQGKTLLEVSKLTNRSRPTIEKIQKQDLQRIEALKKRIADKCLEISERALEAITQEKLKDTSAHSLVSTAREATYTHFLSKEGISPDATKQQIVIQGIQFTFQNPANKTSPVLGGFKDSKVVEVEEVKPIEKKSEE